MRKWLVPVACVLGTSLSVAAEDASPKAAALLSQVRSKMIANLSRLPNYTCLQTIERKVRYAGSRRFQPIDTVRLEVALVDGKELFSWPGAGKFEDKDINELVTGGAIGNGTFALHAKSIFESRSARITFVGDEVKDGQQRLRWDYEVAKAHSGYTMRSGKREAVVGYHGSFWVDSSTMDVMRLEVNADEIPAELRLARASDSVDYMHADIGGHTFLLPQSAELRMVDDGNSESVNQTHFTSCRQYLGESKLSFTDPAPEAANPVAVKVIDLPPGLMLEVSLDTPIASESSAVGDPVTAVVQRAVKRDGTIIVPKGAVLHGRITLLRRQNISRGAYAIGLEFADFEFPGAKGTLHVELDQIAANPGIFGTPGSTRFGPNWHLNNAAAPVKLEAPGSVFFVRGDSFRLARGLHMYWRTQSPPEEK